MYYTVKAIQDSPLERVGDPVFIHTSKINVAVYATEPLHDPSSAGGPEPSRAAAGSHIKAAAGRARDN